MATTNVPKGAGRPVAVAKSRKHAQRSLLPPKKGSPGAEAIEANSCEGGEEAHYAHLDANDQCPWDHASDREKIVEEARAIVPDPAPEKPMGERTVAELRKIASDLLVPGTRGMKRGDLLNAILEAERAKTSTAQRLAGRDLAADVFEIAEKSKPATAPAPRQREVKNVCSGDINPSPEQLKSMAKADAFLAAAAALGWGEKTRSRSDQETYGVIVGRGEERITISWRFGVFVGEECYHSHPLRMPRKVINASAAKKIMAIPAAQADEEARRVSAHRNLAPRRDRVAGAATAGRKALPFDPETAEDSTVLDAVRNRRISWRNGVSGAIEDAYVAGDPRMQAGKTGRSIRFTSTTGYRSVRVSSILSIR